MIKIYPNFFIQKKRILYADRSIFSGDSSRIRNFEWYFFFFKKKDVVSEIINYSYGLTHNNQNSQKILDEFSNQYSTCYGKTLKIIESGIDYQARASCGVQSTGSAGHDYEIEHEFSKLKKYLTTYFFG